MDLVIFPVFQSGRLEDNARELCDLFHLGDESKVPVACFTIVSDGHEMVAAVDPGKYKTALLLLYFMDRAGTCEYGLTSEMRDMISVYYGPELIIDAQQPGTKHKALQALLGYAVHVKLVLQPGYRECLAAGCRLEEIVRHAWERRDNITPMAPELFLRLALQRFFTLLETKALQVASSEVGPWPTPLWADRALALQKQLGI